MRGAALIGALLVGCGAPARVSTPPKTNATDETAQSFASPAHWAYFPREPGQPTATLELSDHRCVVLTDSGDRWLTRGTANTPCKGPAVASSSPAYEALVGALAVGGEYQFIAQSGTVFVSKDPLGAFVRVTKPLRPLRQVASANGAIVGIDDAGKAFYFSPEPSSSSSGAWQQATQPAGSEIIAVGVDDHGRALAIGVPETVLTSTDGGKTFVPAGAGSPPHIGAVSVTRSKRGELAIEGVMGSLIWEAGGSFTRSNDPLPQSSAIGGAIDPSPTPASTAIREGRGVVTGDRYYDLRAPGSSVVAAAAQDPEPQSEQARDAARSSYVLARGPLAGPLELVPLKAAEPKAFSDCAEMHLTARGKNVVLACSHSVATGTDMGVTLYYSSNAGDRFDPVGELYTPSFSESAMAMGADGSLMLTNVCRHGAEKRKHKDEQAAPPGCHPRGPIVASIAVDGARATTGSSQPPKLDKNPSARAVAPTKSGGLTASFIQGNVQQLGAAAFAPAVGVDGRFYFLGRRKKDDRPAIFVSTDGGRSYDARPLEAPAQEAAPAIDDGNTGEQDVAYTNLDFSGDARLTIDDSGTLGLACDSSAGYTWVTADSEGRVATVSGAPEQGASVGGWGRRVVSVGYGAQDGVIRAWESNDGGQSFSEITTTAAVGNYFNGDTMIACDGGGCVLGETLARVGWEGQAETPLNAQDDFPASLEPKLRPALSCELSAKSGWTSVRNLSIAPNTYPRLFDMMRGSTAWSLMTREPESGEVDVTSASLPDKALDNATVQTRVLLEGQRGNKNPIAVAIHPQYEGYVAARVALPESKGRLEVGKPVDGLEVSWVNFYSGTWGKRTLHDVGVWSPNMVSGAVLSPALLTITGSGVVFRAGPTPKSVFFDSANKTTSFDYPDWNALGVNGAVNTPDAALVGGQIFAVGFVNRPLANVIAIAQKPHGSAVYQTDAITYGSSSSEVEWVYRGADNGVSSLSTNVDQDTSEAWASLVEPSGGLGERVRLPTLRDLGDRPRPCAADDRKNTFRTVASVFSKRGTLLYKSGRQPIVVTDGAQGSKSLTQTEPIWFLSDGAVLYGSQKDPCLAGIHGSSVRRGAVVVIGGDMEHAWMFRPSTMGSPATEPICNCNPDDPSCNCPQPSAPSKAKRRTQLSSVEYRAMTCKLKPELVPPSEVGAVSLVRSPDDIP